MKKSKEKKLELKRMQASFNQLKKESKKINLNKCLNCKKDSGKNFTLKYKKNNELKGKICLGCAGSS